MTDHKEYIAALLFEKIAGTISEDDDLIVEDAILRDAEVRAQWQVLQQKMSSPAAEAFLSGINADAAWLQTSGRMAEPSLQPVVRRSRYWQLAGVAAILALTLPLAWYFISLRNRVEPSAALKLAASNQIYLKSDDGQLMEISGNQQWSVGDAKLKATADELSYQTKAGTADVRSVTLVVPATKDYKITLSDGTKVWMNASSSLRFPLHFGKRRREVHLTGEAYFEVTKNKEQEFVVHTGSADVRVHGTSFNVSAYDTEQFSAALVEGSVSALKDGKLLRLKPGEKAVLTNDDLHMEHFDAQEVLAWMHGTYFFHNQALSDIAPVISRWFDVKVAWQSPSIAQQTFTGEIDRRLPLAVVLSNLQLSSGIKAELKNGILTFK
ncbi:putative anti-sigma factor [Pedobacter sp. BAL39]|uniref:FecR family protein n=1 Tax=Pedobacter sp. BAL39 TaxID=391596 RepID=UPI0001559F95|nr:FecR family protein [Pedobacter sp. BAL39]EDM34919.1 putative anti-sigma factor [Pedobacter sp. BAL39]